MGSSRVLYAKTSNRINLSRFITISAILCVIAYLVTATATIPIISLIGCAVCGLSVGIMWPGTYSLATQRIPNVSVSMFALLAIAGDLGCLAGPTLTGWIADIFDNDLKISFLICTTFPIFILVFGLWIKAKTKEKR